MSGTDICDIVVNLLCSEPSMEQNSIHEAGHRVMWKLAFPNIPTRYSFQRGTNLPCVEPKSRAPFLLDRMTVEEASSLIQVKLGGYASEILHGGNADKCEAIAEYLTLDWYSYAYEKNVSHRFDWEDDEKAGGDFSNVFQILERKCFSHTIENYRVNMVTFLCGCVKNLQNNIELYENECRIAKRFFCKSGRRK